MRVTIWWRRRRDRQIASSTWIAAVAATEAQVLALSGVTALPKGGDPAGPRFIAVEGARINAQPIAALTNDRILLWPLAPQLRRSPFSHDVLRKRIPAAEVLAGSSFFAGVDGFSYFHWLTGTVPKLIAAKNAGIDWAELTRILVNPRHKPKNNQADFQMRSLDLLGVPAEKIVWIERGLNMQAERMIFASSPTRDNQTVFEDWALQGLRAFFLAAAGSGPGTPHKIFISRSKARRRRLVDEPALVAYLAGHGFTSIVLEELDILAQVRLFAGARAVIGLHGAGLTNTAFSPAGARVYEIKPSTWKNQCFRNLSTQSGCQHVHVPATPAGVRAGFADDLTVTIDAIRSLLEKYGDD